MSERMTLAALVLSAAGLVGIVSFEGYSGTAAAPVSGDKPTLGFGTTTHADGSPVLAGEKTTPPRALERAMQDVRRFEGALRRCVAVPLHQYEYDAFLSFAYNVGDGAFCRSRLVARLNAGDYRGACDELLSWRYFRGDDCSQAENRSLCGGIWTRRQTERRRCLGEFQ